MQRTFLSFLLALLFVVVRAPAQDSPAPTDDLLGLARGMVAQATTGRRTFIEGKLAETKIAYERLPFLDAKLKGVNVEVAFGPSSGPALVLAAHHDARAGSLGANDDASGCAVLIALARRLQKRQDLRRPLRLVFLDGSQKGLIGATAWCEARSELEVDRVLVLDLCGHGDRLVVGSRQHPYASTAPALVPGAVCFDGDLPTDHKAFVNAGLDAAYLSVSPEQELATLRERYDRRDLRAPLPPYLVEAVRGRDAAEGLEEPALQLVLDAALAAVDAHQAGKNAGRRPRVDFAARMKVLDEAIRTGDLAAARKSLTELGPAAVIEVLAWPCPAADSDQKSATALRLAAGAELRELVAAILKDPVAAAGKAAAAKARLRQDKDQIVLTE